MKQNTYAGILSTPSDNFQAVRDNRRTMPFWMDIDLTSARTELTAQLINASGNSFYIDANPTDGTALIEFQDTGSDNSSVRLFVSPGAIFNLPFTQFKITNSAQPGKKIRIVYGVDVDFQPGSVTQISLNGVVNARPEPQTNSFSDVSVLVANTPIAIFTPASNVNGAVLLSAYSTEVITTGGIAVFIAKSSAPVSTVDGSIVLQGQCFGGVNGTVCGVLPKEQYIAAGLGLYYIASAALGASAYNIRSARYKLL